MNKILNILLTLLILVTSIKNSNSQEFDNGDIIFHTSLSSQSELIQAATNSKLSHVGIVYVKDGKSYVFEAVEPVKLTPLSEWINRGVNGKYRVFRYFNKSTTGRLTKKELDKMYEYCLSQKDKPYDLRFQWGDDKIYCSELVWKTYNSVGIKLCEPKPFSDFNIQSNRIKEEIDRRYGEDFVESEPVVSPQCLLECVYLYEVFNNY